MSPIGDDVDCVLGHGVAAYAASDRVPIGDADVDLPNDREPMSHLHAGGQQVGQDRNLDHELGATSEHDRRE